MSKFFTELSDDLIQFIRDQHMFFTATAPKKGRINLSPKGMDTFRCFGPNQVAYLDLTGSGNETSAHLQENPRITVMLCSFGQVPMIMRLYGKGRIVLPQDAEWNTLMAQFDDCPGARQIILVDIETVQTSCGYAVPVYDFKEERQALRRWAAHKGPEELKAYRREKNAVSIDGLPSRAFDDTTI